MEPTGLLIKPCRASGRVPDAEILVQVCVISYAESTPILPISVDGILKPGLHLEWNLLSCPPCQLKTQIQSLPHTLPTALPTVVRKSRAGVWKSAPAPICLWIPVHIAAQTQAFWTTVASIQHTEQANLLSAPGRSSSLLVDVLIRAANLRPCDGTNQWFSITIQ